jgi:hypothetical protein
MCFSHSVNDYICGQSIDNSKAMERFYINPHLHNVERTFFLQKSKYHTCIKVNVTRSKNETNMLEMKHISCRYHEYESTVS